MIRLLLGLALLITTAESSVTAQTPRDSVLPPAALVGRWTDDYGNAFEISPETWLQAPHGRYHVVSWMNSERVVIAQRDPTSTESRTLWLRIDWMTFDGMPPWQWGFCLTAWEAPTRDAAERTKPADRTTPRTGCGGHPFSRMRRPP